jgi:hypothetical protein
LQPSVPLWVQRIHVRPLMVTASSVTTSIDIECG